MERLADIADRKCGENAGPRRLRVLPAWRPLARAPGARVTCGAMVAKECPRVRVPRRVSRRRQSQCRRGRAERTVFAPKSLALPARTGQAPRGWTGSWRKRWNGLQRSGKPWRTSLPSWRWCNLAAHAIETVTRKRFPLQQESPPACPVPACPVPACPVPRALFRSHYSLTMRLVCRPLSMLLWCCMSFKQHCTLLKEARR